MAATERAHFREPSSFEGAWWPLTATVLTRSPHQHSTAIIVFTKVRGDQGETLLVDVWNQGWRVACLSHATVALWGNMTWDHSQSGGDGVSTRQSSFQWKCHWVCVVFFFLWRLWTAEIWILTYVEVLSHSDEALWRWSRGCFVRKLFSLINFV